MTVSPGVISLHNQIEGYMKQLRLGSLAKEWQSVAFKTREQYLADLLLLELREREVNRINRLVKGAAFPVVKSLDDFKWTGQIEIYDQDISKESLERLDFITDRENLIFMGAVGTGKSHLASALALKACQNGHQVRFYTAARLANILYEKNKKGQFESFIKSLQKLGLLVIDEIGFVPLHMEAAELLYQVIADCYERRSVIVTTNLEFSHWNTVFIGKKVTAAIIDRLVHHSHILIFSGESYRLAQSMKRAGKKVTE